LAGDGTAAEMTVSLGRGFVLGKKDCDTQIYKQKHWAWTVL
jgi:hypothetical protein